MAIWGMGIMVGPILGPVIGGWLTDNYNWRWVFYVNLPIGDRLLRDPVGAAAVAAAEARASSTCSASRCWRSAIASLQLMLDRGQNEDWFSSTEVIVEGADRAVCGVDVRRPHVHRRRTRCSTASCSPTAIW